MKKPTSVSERERLPAFGWYGACRFAGLTPPILLTRQGDAYRATGGRKMERDLMRFFFKGPSFRAAVYDRRFAVAQSAWPEVAERAFGLEEPPTPWEVASAFLAHASDERTWLAHVFEVSKTLSSRIFQWWLMGVPTAAFCDVLAESREEVEGRLSTAIRDALDVPVFALWALGTDPGPVTSTAYGRAVAEAVQCGYYPETYRHAHERDAVAAFLAHPHIKSQYASGKRVYPTPRVLHHVGVVWKTQEEKDGTKRYWPAWRDRLYAGRRGCLQAFKPLPAWADVAPPPEGWIPQSKPERARTDRKAS